MSRVQFLLKLLLFIGISKKYPGSPPCTVGVIRWESEAGKAQCLLTGESTATRRTHRAALDGPCGSPWGQDAIRRVEKQ